MRRVFFRTRVGITAPMRVPATGRSPEETVRFGMESGSCEWNEARWYDLRVNAEAQRACGAGKSIGLYVSACSAVSLQGLALFLPEFS